MPPKQNKDVNQDDWVELRRTLQEMQINMHTSIQQSHESFQLTLQEVLTTIGQHQQPHQQQRQHQRRDEHVIEDDEDRDDENPFASLQAQVNRPRNWDRGPMVEDRRWENGFKSDLPEFTGSIRGEELVDWLVTVEEIIEFKQVSANRQVALVATKFRGQAASWWLQLKSTRAREGKPKIATWEKLKKKLRKTFLPYNFDGTMFTRLQNLRQGSRTVDEYAEEFYSLMTCNEIHDSEIQLVSRFIGGLRPQLQNALEQFDPNTVAEAHRRAASFERQSRSSSTNWNSSARFRNTTSQDQTTGQGLNNTNSETTCVPASNCASTSTEEQTLRCSSRPNALRCFTCGEQGHIQTACPNKSKRGLIIEEVDPTYDDYHEDNEDELGH
uniref:CCHC-type domain-containing protein n=1 Tax=Brassica oleracea var. oleracea TaxID=109376 RepID=A0A0D3AV87_BRAOL